MEDGLPDDEIKLVESDEIDELQIELDRIKTLLLASRNDSNDSSKLILKSLADALDDLTSKHCELQFARNKAEQSNQSNAILLTNMNNRIAMPVSGIRNLLTLINQTNLAATRQRYADISLKSIRDLNRFIGEILDPSKMKSAQPQIVNHHFDLYEAIKQVRDLFFINGLTKKIDLILIIYRDTPRFVWGDKLRLKQLLHNLVVSAIEFTDKGEVVIKVMVEQQIESDVTIVITIEDTSCGLSEKHQETLFETFRQIDTTNGVNLTGSESGLVIGKYLTRLMSGELSLQSGTNRGSKVNVSLPFLLTSPPGESDPVIQYGSQTAVILSSRKNCLQEITTLFDGAHIATESILLDKSDDATNINFKIRENLQHIDFLVIDLRHLDLDLNEVIENIGGTWLRLIIMHYDETLIKIPFYLKYEFIATTTNSRQLKISLDHPLFNQGTDSVITANESNPVASKNVLLVDDDQINLKILSDLIKSWGHQVFESDNAIQAMDLYSHESFDLMIIELRMPVINGIILLKMIRRENPLDQTLSIALTENMGDDEQLKCLTSGFNYCLSKPIDETQLRRILEADNNTNDDNNASSSGKGYEFNLEDSLAEHSFDLQQSLVLSLGNYATLRKILEILIRDIPDMKQQLNSAASENDQIKLSAILHKLQGITCYISLPRLRQRASSLQQSRLTNSYNQQQDRILQICGELDSIQHETQQWLSEQDVSQES